MEQEFKVSDMELTARASKVLRYDEYLRIRANYYIHNPKRYVEADTHRRIMESAVRLAKKVADEGDEEEIKRACVYMYICFDTRKCRLDWHRARRDLKIDDLVQKYAEP